jgi:hypothetical protein
MSLLHRATKLEALAESHVIKKDWAAFREWLRTLSREEAFEFLDFCLPTMVANHWAPPYRVLPSQMTRDERTAYHEAFTKMIAERKEFGHSMSDNRIIMDMWRRFVQRGQKRADESR